MLILNLFCNVDLSSAINYERMPAPSCDEALPQTMIMMKMLCIADKASPDLAVRVPGGVLHRGGHVPVQAVGGVGLPGRSLLLLHHPHYHWLWGLRARAGIRRAVVLQ
jgi:hypothetical protein